MNEERFKKDTTPYIVFCCSKCNQYSYVKTTQKTKKCLRCGRTHKVKNILDKGEIVYGMSIAVRLLQDKQNELGLKANTGLVAFNSKNDFKIALNKPQNVSTFLSNNNYSEKFFALLKDLFKQHETFPRYMMEIMAENYRIPNTEINFLIHEFQIKGVLILVKNNEEYFTLNI